MRFMPGGRFGGHNPCFGRVLARSQPPSRRRRDAQRPTSHVLRQKRQALIRLHQSSPQQIGQGGNQAVAQGHGQQLGIGQRHPQPQQQDRFKHPKAPRSPRHHQSRRPGQGEASQPGRPGDDALQIESPDATREASEAEQHEQQLQQQRRPWIPRKRESRPTSA